MPKRKTVPKFSSFEEAGEWLDSHSIAGLKTTPAHFELSPQFTIRIAEGREEETSIPIDHTLSKQISQIARQQGISVEALVNRWLVEKAGESTNPVAY